MTMTITRFTQEVSRIKTKFQSGSKPSGKDFRELIYLFYEFYVDLTGGYTEILKQQTLAQIEEVVGEYMIDNNGIIDNTVQSGTVLDLTKSSTNTFNIISGTTFTFILPEADKSTTMFLKIINDTSSVQSISFTGITASNWANGDFITEIPIGETHIIKITSYGDVVGNLVLTRKKLG